MRKVSKLVWLSFLSIFFAYGATAQTAVFSDSFSDGKIDPILWAKPGWATLKSQENSGHLRIFNNPTNTTSSQYGGLVANFARKYNKGDAFSVYAKVRVPHIIPPNPGGPITNGFEVGIGLFQSMTLANNIELTVRDTQSNRQFGIYYYSESLSKTQYWSFPAPTNISVFKLKMTYSCGTDNVGFYWAPPSSNSWTKIIKFIKMADLFGPSASKVMTPYVTSSVEKMQISRDMNVWLDDFMAVYVNKPL
jgi:hypothetical protein